MEKEWFPEPSENKKSICRELEEYIHQSFLWPPVTQLSASNWKQENKGVHRCKPRASCSKEKGEEWWVDCCCSVAQYIRLFEIPWIAACQASLSFIISPRVCSNSCPVSQWCHPTSHPLSPSSPPALHLSQHQGLFQWVWLFASGGQSIGVSASTSVLPLNIQGWFPLGLTDLISLLSKELSKAFSSTNLKASVLQCSAVLMVLLSHVCMTTGETIGLTVQAFVGKRMSLLFNTLSRFVKAFLSRSKHLLISWLQSPFNDFGS